MKSLVSETWNAVLLECEATYTVCGWEWVAIDRQYFCAVTFHAKRVNSSFSLIVANITENAFLITLPLCKKHNALQLPLFFSLFSCLRCRALKIVTWYSWFWKSLNMADRDNEFSFFWDIHVRIDIRTDISISWRPMTIKFVKLVHLEEATQMRLIKQVMMKSSHQYHMTN